MVILLAYFFKVYSVYAPPPNFLFLIEAQNISDTVDGTCISPLSSQKHKNTEI